MSPGKMPKTGRRKEKQQTRIKTGARKAPETLFLQKLTGQYCSRCLQN